MATIKLQNTREHEISLSAFDKDNNLTTVTVPAGRDDGNGGFTKGFAEADDSFVEIARKSPVVAHYFDEGWLSVVKPAATGKAKAAE
jgi:hypothetical protein